MLRKITLVTAMALVLGAVTSMAYSAGTTSRESSGDRIQTQPLDYELTRPMRGAIKKCPSGNITLRCVNKNLNKLRKAFNGLAASHNSLAAFITTCLQRASVTQYGDGAGNTFGYEYDDNGGGGGGFFYTSALDFTVPGDPASAQMVVAVC